MFGGDLFRLFQSANANNKMRRPLLNIYEQINSVRVRWGFEEGKGALAPLRRTEWKIRTFGGRWSIVDGEWNFYRRAVRETHINSFIADSARHVFIYVENQNSTANALVVRVFQSFETLETSRTKRVSGRCDVAGKKINVPHNVYVAKVLTQSRN